jgi:hypothetical protein
MEVFGALIELIVGLFAADDRRAARWRIYGCSLLLVVLLGGVASFFGLR